MANKQIFVKLLNGKARIPDKKREHDVGYDLYSIDDEIVLPHERTLVPTGIALEMPHNVFGKIFDRSGLASKTSLIVKAGVIDPEYRGEIKVVLENNGESPAEIKSGERIAQIVFLPYEKVDFNAAMILSTTDRGENGFGSREKLEQLNDEKEY